MAARFWTWLRKPRSGRPLDGRPDDDVVVRGGRWKDTRETRPDARTHPSAAAHLRWIKRLRARDAHDRRIAAEALGRAAARAAIPDLIRAAVDADAAVRKAAAEALTAIDADWPRCEEAAPAARPCCPPSTAA